MRISDWSSDVCSSDLIGKAAAEQPGEGDAKGELVGLLIAPVPLVNLGSHIARRTWNIGSGRVFDARQPRHAEIDQPQPAVLGDDEVFRLYRSEERRVGKECVSTCRSRGAPYN